MGSLYPQLYDDEDALLGDAIRRARARYPVTDAEVETFLTVNNKRRKSINALRNRKLAPSTAVSAPCEGEDPKAQNMLLWPGLALQAAITHRGHDIKNALRFQSVQ